MLAANMSEDVVIGTVETWVAETSNFMVNDVTGSQEMKEGCKIMQRMMEDQRQWRDTLAK